MAYSYDRPVDPRPANILATTPPDRLVDGRNRPYFLWDCDVDLDGLRERLNDSNPVVSGYWLAKLMRQAKPDDVFTFARWSDIERLWPQLERHLGEKRAFWTWFLGVWQRRHAPQ